MRDGQHDRTTDRKYAVRNDAERIVRDGRSNAQQNQARHCTQDDTQVAVPGETGADGHDAQGYNDEQHLHVQVASGQWQQGRQRAHDEGQRQAMQEAQTRQSDGRAIEPVRRFRGCLIHPEMPLCWAGGGLRSAAGDSGRK